MTITKTRRARRAHECGCGRWITAGEVYLVHTVFPGSCDDAGYATYAGHPVRLAECGHCARRYGRANLLGGTR